MQTLSEPTCIKSVVVKQSRLRMRVFTTGSNLKILNEDKNALCMRFHTRFWSQGTFLHVYMYIVHESQPLYSIANTLYVCY